MCLCLCMNRVVYIYIYIQITHITHYKIEYIYIYAQVRSRYKSTRLSCEDIKNKKNKNKKQNKTTQPLQCVNQSLYITIITMDLYGQKIFLIIISKLILSLIYVFSKEKNFLRLLLDSVFIDRSINKYIYLQRERERVIKQRTKN